ncbi:hypothetical protein AYR62_14705 [Secundilactobacillus paracollinoides]|uniref:Uncharacterized protein n=1 Tax=Secundilactobacillus paracollinoides TaxID=240427 RepID=A0A1B2IXC9_9LACO|nr:hypothetical protein AYR61_05325 [Secundilactobacillus paracollinoides]ANZ65206.1 hypothetical protein AYR62_14705 [Secundilactobacillus paracollinoides]ANZ66679.1 hypothetical protein AYR63_05695 [Secundilactobacillus paracollinoides]
MQWCRVWRRPFRGRSVSSFRQKFPNLEFVPEAAYAVAPWPLEHVSATWPRNAVPKAIGELKPRLTTDKSKTIFNREHKKTSTKSW